MLDPERVGMAMRLGVLEHLVNTLFVTQYGARGLTLADVEEAHRKMLEDAAREPWPIRDPTMADLLSDEFVQALSRMLSAQRAMMKSRRTRK